MRSVRIGVNLVIPAIIAAMHAVAIVAAGLYLGSLAVILVGLATVLLGLMVCYAALILWLWRRLDGLRVEDLPPQPSIQYAGLDTLDFCLRVLREDGLRVPPFVAHGEGNGVLRAAGLDQQDWLDWVSRVVCSAEEQAAALAMLLDRDRSDGAAADERLRWRFDGAENPVRAWAGSPAVRERLSALWAGFHDELHGRLSGMPSWWVRDSPTGFFGIARLGKSSPFGSPIDRPTWSEMEPYLAPTADYHFYLARYEATVYLLLPPLPRPRGGRIICPIILGTSTGGFTDECPLVIMAALMASHASSA